MSIQYSTWQSTMLNVLPSLQIIFSERNPRKWFHKFSGTEPSFTSGC